MKTHLDIITFQKQMSQKAEKQEISINLPTDQMYKFRQQYQQNLYALKPGRGKKDQLKGLFAKPGSKVFEQETHKELTRLEDGSSAKNIKDALLKTFPFNRYTTAYGKLSDVTYDNCTMHFVIKVCLNQTQIPKYDPFIIQYLVKLDQATDHEFI